MSVAVWACGLVGAWVWGRPFHGPVVSGRGPEGWGLVAAPFRRDLWIFEAFCLNRVVLRGVKC